jgi:hypothetical protein
VEWDKGSGKKDGGVKEGGIKMDAIVHRNKLVETTMKSFSNDLIASAEPLVIRSIFIQPLVEGSTMLDLVEFNLKNSNLKVVYRCD